MLRKADWHVARVAKLGKDARPNQITWNNAQRDMYLAHVETLQGMLSGTVKRTDLEPYVLKVLSRHEDRAKAADKAPARKAKAKIVETVKVAKARTPGKRVAKNADTVQATNVAMKARATSQAAHQAIKSGKATWTNVDAVVTYIVTLDDGAAADLLARLAQDAPALESRVLRKLGAMDLDA
jgi:hypothetical protein